MLAARHDAAGLELAGAAGFGAVIGWYLYYLNRYRQDEIKAQDLVTVIAALGGGAILRLFPARSELFGAYGIGLFAGFFGYFVVLVIMVVLSGKFSLDWFLEEHSGQRPMEARDDVLPR